MELRDYMNSHNEWEKELAAAPYNLEIKWDNEYVLFKYNQFLSDFNLPLVREARGSIFKKINGIWECVCYPFNKFANWGEDYADTPYLDWDSIQVQQKVDGSLIKFWFDNGEYHISTNGTIDAFKCECGDTTFGQLVLNCCRKIPNFFQSLRPSYTYMFELTSPQNQLVCNYGEEAQLWYLGCRNMVTLQEEECHLKIESIKYPQLYKFESLEKCIDAAHLLDENSEGWVCVDKNWRRVKVKGDEYLRLNKLRGNGPVTFSRLVDIWKENSLDDFLAAFPQYKEKVQTMVETLIEWNNKVMKIWDSLRQETNRKEFATRALLYTPPIPACLFALCDHKVKNGFEFLENLSTQKVVKLLEVKEDE